MFNMMFLMIPYGAVIAYSSILAQEKGLMAVLPYFYIFLVCGMLLSKLSTQRMIDAGKHKLLVYISLACLIITMLSYIFLATGLHLLIAGFFFGLGYGILQPLFQSFVTGTTPPLKRGVANATYLLSYDIGIGLGSLLMGFMQESIGLTNGFALTAIAYVIGAIIYMVYVDEYYLKLKGSYTSSYIAEKSADLVSNYMQREVYTLGENATIREAISLFAQKNISGAPIVSANNSAVGFISDGDIMRYLKPGEHILAAIDTSVLFMEYFWNPDAEFKEKLNSIMELNVLEIGTNKPITISENTSFEDALRLLSKSGVKKVPVVSADKVVGIVSRSAITNYLTKRYLANSQAV